MDGLCTECPNRSLCNTLCPEAELYVKQDEIAQRELTIGIPRHGKWPETSEKSLFTKTEKRIIDALVEGKTRKQIAQELGITRKNLRDLIYLLRKKHREETPKTGGE